MTLKNNRAPLLSNIKLYVSFHHHMWIQTGVTVRKRLSWVVTCDLDLWPWPFAWTLPWSLVITPENFMMILWWEHSQKGVTDRQTDRQMKGQLEIAYLPKFANRDNAHCNGDSDNWNIVDYIDVWLVWKSIGLHVLAFWPVGWICIHLLYPSDFDVTLWLYQWRHQHQKYFFGG